MNATRRCPVCPLDDIAETATHCPNCKTDLTVLRRIEGLADAFVRDADAQRPRDPAGALRSLHAALALDPSNEEARQQLDAAQVRTEVPRDEAPSRRPMAGTAWGAVAAASITLAFYGGTLWPASPPDAPATPPPQRPAAALVDAAPATPAALAPAADAATLQRALGRGYRVTADARAIYVSLRGPAFAPGDVQLQPRETEAMRRALLAVARLQRPLEIVGHADAHGSPRNDDLARERAITVATLAHRVAPAARVSVDAQPRQPITGTRLADESNRGVAIGISLESDALTAATPPARPSPIHPRPR